MSSTHSCMDPMFIYSVYLFVGRRVLHTEDDLKIYWPSRMICKSCFPKGLAHCIKLELKYCFRLKFCIPFIEKIKNFAYFAKKKFKFRIFALQFSKCILAKNVKFRIFRKSFLSTKT